MEYTQTLYEPYVLKPLDAATVRRKPSRPATETTIVLGAAFGLILGAGLAFLADYLKTPLETIVSVNVLDPEIGVYSRDFFVQRLRIEMARAERQGYPLSIVLLNVDQLGTIRGARSPQAQSEILRKTAVSLRQYLREEDLVAYFGAATFAIMLPDVKAETAQSTAERLKARVAWSPVELERSGVKVNLTSVAGVAALDGEITEVDQLILAADHKLRRAETARPDGVFTATEEQLTPYDQPAQG
jgi:diguanylate cyclase (GGDEF)-like protein